MRTTLFVVISLLAITCCGASRGSEATTLKVGGTGSSLGFMRLLGKSYSALHPEVTVEVLPSLGTGGGIRAVKTGAIDLAIASRRLTEEEKAGVTSHFIGLSPFVFAVHPETDIDDVTLPQVVGIYNGTISTWRDGSRVRRVLRPVEDVDWQLMRTLSPELAEALEIARETEGLFLAVTDTDATGYLEQTRGSFGPATLTMILAENRKVKILSFNGMKPGISGPDAQTYPLMKSYLLLTSRDTSPAVEKFIDFIHSSQGREILARAGITSGDEQSQ